MLTKTQFQNLSKMKIRRSTLILLFTISILALACSSNNKTNSGPAGFTADISGAIEGTVSGPGLVQFIPGNQSGPGSHPDYFFIADDSGVREFGITFTIPEGAMSGTFPLVTAHPLDTGEEFELRVDHSVGNQTTSFLYNTSGTITIDDFPENGQTISDHRIAGSFEFTTEDDNKRQISVTGSFEFNGKNR